MAQGFLLDTDGMIYSGEELITGATNFIQEFQDKDIPFLFVTNNS